MLLFFPGHHDVCGVRQQDRDHGGQDGRLRHLHPDPEHDQVRDEADQLQEQQSGC